MSRSWANAITEKEILDRAIEKYITIELFQQAAAKNILREGFFYFVKSENAMYFATSSSTYNVVTIRNNITNNNLANYAEIFISFCSIAGYNLASGTYLTFTVLRNAQITTSPANTNFTRVDPSSFVSYNTSVSTVSGGNALFTFIVTSNNTSQVIDMVDLDVVIAPGDTLTLAATSSDITSNAIGGFSWVENT